LRTIKEGEWIMKKMRLTDVLLIVLPITAIVLELLPHGVALNFGYPSETGDILYERETYAYFSLMPFGYAVFGPLLAAVLTCVTTVIAALSAFLKRNWKNTIATICTVAAFASLSPLLMGLRYFTVLGAIITLILSAEVFLAFRFRQR
jgi:hypothetical protein